MELFRRDVDRRFSLDLAEHLLAVSTPPPLTAGWSCEVAVALANDAAIGGDFTVFSLSESGDHLRAMVVDASGKGAEAATRSVMLAGAISGLLAELPTCLVLPAVNRHVARLGSAEDFATAALLDVDLRSGNFKVAVAGHPPAIHFDAGSGRWHQYDVTGPALGFLPDAEWELRSGHLAPDDAFIIVTDGVIEVPGADLEWGIDRMMGQAEHLVLSGWAGGAQRLLAQRRRPGSDDAQVLLLAHSNRR